MTPRAAASKAPARGSPTGPLPHACRILRRALRPGTLVGALRELRGLGTAVLLYPLGLRPAPLVSEPGEPAQDTHELPVILVHGYFHNRSGFFALGRALRRAGFRWVHAMNYNPLGETVPGLARRLAREVEDVLRVTGAPKVHVVGHSLGGVIARWYVQELGGARFVDTCVTIGTPHRGTYVAYLGLGETARQMRPGSPVLRRLEATLPRTQTRFVNLYSDLDVLIVPPSSAVLPPSPRVHNHLIHDLGHVSLLISPELISVVTRQLASSDVRIRLADVRPLPEPRSSRTAERRSR